MPQLSCLLEQEQEWTRLRAQPCRTSYLGWHSNNLRLVNCHIGGEQPLCYARNLVLENCTFDPASDRAFEYSTVQADIRGHIASVKNPAGGRIVADSYGEVIIDENIKGPADCQIITRNKQ